ncbi:MAG: DUF202 domain-containing protein [Cyanobacteria bacterium P01_F01_bin.3]
MAYPSEPQPPRQSPGQPSGRRSSDKQREHQANERTYLAWLRTSISLIGFGFAIARFGIFLQQISPADAPENPPFFSSRLIGISLVGFGVFSIILAAYRYNQAFMQIERGRYKPNRGVIWLLSAMVTALGLLCIPLLF